MGKYGPEKAPYLDTFHAVSSIDNDKEHVIHSEIDNIEIMINDEVDEVIKKLFESLKNRYQNNLE